MVIVAYPTPIKMINNIINSFSVQINTIIIAIVMCDYNLFDISFVLNFYLKFP